MGIKENEKLVYENVAGEIKLKGNSYTVKLPFKGDHPVILQNYLLSAVRLKALKNRHDKDKLLLQKYDDVIKEKLEFGIIEKIDTLIVAEEGTYIPHREVIREDHESTKLRADFDCSAKCGNNISLNESLYKDPSLNPHLFDLFIKFRLYPIAITADIEEANLKFNVHKSHRDYIRFSWFSDINSKNPVTECYRFSRILFGATC